MSAVVTRTAKQASNGMGVVPPTAERIRARAYEIYRARLRAGSKGDAVSDWLAAEREVNGAAAAARDVRVQARAGARGEVLLAGDAE